MRTDAQIQWWVPIRYQIGQARRELPIVFPARVLVRLGLVTIAIVCAASYFLPKALPDLEVDWVAMALKCMGCLFAILAMCCVVAIVPPLITISQKGITITQGQHTRRFTYCELAELRLETGSEPWAMLILRPRQRQKNSTYPVSASVSLDSLRRMLDEHWQFKKMHNNGPSVQVTRDVQQTKNNHRAGSLAPQP